jgi:hypothetical protein
MKPGTKLKSAVCSAEVLVIRADAASVVHCGGVPMLETAPAAQSPVDPHFAGGTQMGKRYEDEAGTIQLLCIKSGQGSLSLDGAALKIKDAKALPSSD